MIYNKDISVTEKMSFNNAFFRECRVCCERCRCKKDVTTPECAPK